MEFVCTNEIELTCVLTLILSGLSLICIILNCNGVYNMCKSYKKIKFENYVLLSGILEAILFLIASFSQCLYIIQLIKFLQIIILLFITRRFLKIYFILEKKNSKTRFYNYFFIFLVIINISIILVLCVFLTIQLIAEDQTFLSSEGYSYIFLSHSIFSLLSSLTLFILGLQIKKMIKNSLRDSFNHDDLTYYFNHSSNIATATNTREEKIDISRDTEKNVDLTNFKDREIYFSVRILQLNIVITTFLLCDLYQLFYSTTKLFFIPDQFYIAKLRVEPLTNEATLFFFLEYFSVLLPVFTNYLAFFFLIKQYYKNPFNKRKNLENSFDEKDFERFSLTHSKTDIEDFLS